MRLLLATKGLINQTLMGIGIIDTPIDFLGTNVGLYVGLSSASLLVIVFPLLRRESEAWTRADRGGPGPRAPWWRIHRKSSFPMPNPHHIRAAPWC